MTGHGKLAPPAWALGRPCGVIVVIALAVLATESVPAASLAILPPIVAGTSETLDRSELYDRALAAIPGRVILKPRRFVEQVLSEYGLAAGEDLDRLQFEQVASRLAADYIVILRVYPLSRDDHGPERVRVRAWAYSPPTAPEFPGPGRFVAGPLYLPPGAYRYQHAPGCLCGLCDRRERHPADRDYIRAEYTVSTASRSLRMDIAVALVRVDELEEIARAFLEPEASQALRYADYDGDPSRLVDDIRYREGEGFWKSVWRGPQYFSVDVEPFQAPRRFDDRALRQELMTAAARSIGSWVGANLPSTARP